MLLSVAVYFRQNVLNKLCKYMEELETFIYRSNIYYLKYLKYYEHLLFQVFIEIAHKELT